MYRHLLLAVLALATLTSAACAQSDAAPQQEGAESAICGDLEAMSAAARKAAALNSFSSRDDARRSASSLEAAMADIQASAAEYPELQLAQLETAVGDFSAAANRIPTGITLGQTAGALQSDALAIVRVESSLSNRLNCP